MLLRSDKGQSIRLLNPLTRAGGEGQVFEIAGTTAFVAKVYHQPAEPLKATKLRSQVQTAQVALQAIAAWPTDLLVEDSNRNLVRGVLMPRMSGKEIHLLYGPGTRSLEFPKAGWDFLIHVAMNCAAAFQTLHEHSVVMADVNEGNLLVNETDGRVGLIDCDSYQIRNGTAQFTCDVGVPMWTPPELQGRNFRGLARTPNHDLFGLAVLIFRLLFMGRHPFAGIPVGRDQMEVDQAIKHRLFAFSPQVWSRGVKQPPHSLPLEALPEQIRRLFERAFLDSSMSPNARPTGREWAQELKVLLASLKQGCLDPGHKYWNGLKACPWCSITNAGGPNFFISVAIHVGTADWMAEFHRLWSAIDRVINGALMQERATLPSIGKPLGRPMPINRPLPPPMMAPLTPTKPVASPKPVIPSPQLPVRPVKRPHGNPPSIPIGHNERLARLCGLGAIFFACFTGFCHIMEVEVAKLGSAWALVVCVVVGGLKWSRALQERQQRRDMELQAIQSEQHRIEGEYARELMAYESQVKALMQTHAAEVARADAEHQREWLKRDQEYQKSYNSYLTAQREFDATMRKYGIDLALWNSEVDRRTVGEATLFQTLNSAVSQLNTTLTEYQDRVRVAIPPLEAARNRFEKARSDELADLRTLHDRRQELQLHQFLAKQLIRDAGIPGIGGTREATLAAFNICTALDIHANLQVPGFGEVLLGNLMAWRRQWESRFRYNAAVPLPTGEVNAVKVKHAQARQSALSELKSGAKTLEQMETITAAFVNQSKLEILNLARNHAQAAADLTACS